MMKALGFSATLGTTIQQHSVTSLKIESSVFLCWYDCLFVIYFLGNQITVFYSNCGLDGPGFDFQQEQLIFLSGMCRLALGPTQSPIQ